LVVAPKKDETVGEAFHEKKDKNKKVNMKIRRKEAMKIKYGKPKTRGDKNKAKKKK
jgi:ATP-dependent RNA helicase RhlE